MLKIVVSDLGGYEVIPKEDTSTEGQLSLISLVSASVGNRVVSQGEGW